jgi:hypothetical protein
MTADPVVIWKQGGVSQTTEVNPVGVLTDFNRIRKTKKAIIAGIDHGKSGLRRD